MRYRELFEIYSERNSSLGKFLKNGEFDVYNNWSIIIDQLTPDEYYNYFSSILGDNIEDVSELENEDPEIFYKLPKNIQDKIAEKVTEYLLQNDPVEAPTSAYLSLQNKNKPLIKRSTWLIHFTDEPESIATEGFNIGVADQNKLGLTTYISNKSYEKSYGGYNFAFIANSRDAKNATGYRQKYAKHAVMFQNSGVHCWHNSDEENQIIFWGADVNPRDIIVLKHLDDWTVMGKTIYKGNYTSFDKELYAGDFDKCVEWVMKNYQQYRKTLTGF